MSADLSQRDQAILDVREARDRLLESIDWMVSDGAVQKALQERVDALYHACSLVVTMGDEPVYRDAVSRLRREEP